jgi:hypothetical protein
MTELEKCIEFLTKNGWEFDATSKDSDYMLYTKGDLVGVDINKHEIVFVGGEGDFLHLPVNYYVLIGALLEHRQVTTSYISCLPWNKL